MDIGGPGDPPTRTGPPNRDSPPSRTDATGIFAGQQTASAYARGRSEYPPSVVPAIWALANLRARWALANLNLDDLEKGPWVVDLGAGPGNIALPLARYVRAVLAVEPAGDMVKLGKTAVEVAHLNGVDLRNVVWSQSKAEDALAELPDGSIDAITIAAAFHWMDGPRVLDEAYRVLKPGGLIAVISGSDRPEFLGRDYAERDTPFQRDLETVIRKFGANPLKPGEFALQHGDFAVQFARSPFRGSKVHRFDWVKDWDIERLLSYFDSSSFANRKEMGDRANAFKEAVRVTVNRHNPDGKGWRVVAPAVIRYAIR